MAGLQPVTVGIYWVNDYAKPPATCNQDQTKYCDDMASGFAGAMRSRKHTVDVNRREGDASPKHWERNTDSDPNGADTVDFAYLATHGNTRGEERSGGGWVHWVFSTFNSSDGCFWFTVEVGPDFKPPDLANVIPALKLGDGKLRWAVLDLCRSLQVGHKNEKKLAQDPDRALVLRDAHPASTWSRNFAGVHVLFGFTGLSTDGSWVADRGALFGRRAGSGDELAEAWLDEAYSYWCDDAPVAVAWGRTPEDARSRLEQETLANPEPTLSPADVGFARTMWRV